MAKRDRGEMIIERTTKIIYINAPSSCRTANNGIRSISVSLPLVRWLGEQAEPEKPEPVVAPKPPDKPVPSYLRGPLTRREQQVHDMLKEGMKIKEICAKLRLSEGNVRGLVHRAKEKTRLAAVGTVEP